MSWRRASCIVGMFRFKFNDIDGIKKACFKAYMRQKWSRQVLCEYHWTLFVRMYNPIIQATYNKFHCLCFDPTGDRSHDLPLSRRQACYLIRNGFWHLKVPQYILLFTSLLHICTVFVFRSGFSQWHSFIIILWYTYLSNLLVLKLNTDIIVSCFVILTINIYMYNVSYYRFTGNSSQWLL